MINAKNDKKLRRSMLFLPGANAAMLSTSFVYRPDTIMFDLEDAVSLKEKDSARFLVAQTLKTRIYKDQGIETAVRVNALNSPYGLLDLEAVVRAGVDIVRLPKTETAEEIHDLVAKIERIEKEAGLEVGKTKVMAAIESALGVVNAISIAQASPRMIGIAMAAFDYLVDMQTKRGDGSEIFYARCAVLHAARVAKIDAFDVVFSDVNDDEGFMKEALFGKNLGFNGKSLINPRQINLVHKVYEPTQAEIDHSLEVIEAAEEGEKQGLGVISLNGKMIDPPFIARARLVIQLAKSSGLC